MAKLDERKDCPNCGLRLPAASKKCEFCGWDFEEEEDWAIEIDALEKELLAKGRKTEEPPIDKMIGASMRDSTSGKPEAPEEHEPAGEQRPGGRPAGSGEPSFTGLQCPTCDANITKQDKYCPSCGADLEEEEYWALEIAMLEKELLAKGRKIDGTSLDRMIASTIRSPVSGQPEGAAEPEPEPASEPEPGREPPPVGEPVSPAEAEDLIGGLKKASDSDLKCPACGGSISSKDESCPSCGADLEDEEWVTEMEAIEKELLSRHKEFGELPVEEEIEPAVGAAMPEEPEEAPEEEPEAEPTPPEPAPETIGVAEAREPPAPARKPRSIFYGVKEGMPKQAETPPAPPREFQPPAPSREIPRPPRPPWAAEPKGAGRQARGRVNGVRQGMVNGTKRGMVNGTRQGMVNGTRQGMVNGTKRGKVNGIGAGKVNGLKGPAQIGEQKRSRFFGGAGGMFSGRRLMVILIVAILVVSGIFTFYSFKSKKEGIKIDGDFSDWAAIPSYSFSVLIPGEVEGIAEGKISYSQQPSISKLYLYAHLESDLFAGNAVSAMYAFIDADADSATGYSADSLLGADIMVLLSGWNGTIGEAARFLYNSTQDQDDWNSWQTQSGFSYRIAGREVEMSVNVESTAPLAQMVTSIGGEEHRSPIMSQSGTILARQEPIMSGSLATSASPSVMRVRVAAMGIAAGSITMQTSLVNATGQSTPAADMVVNQSAWTTAEFTADISALSQGDGFSYSFRGTASGFQVEVDVTGEPSSGYYMQYPTDIVVDGLFADWDARKSADSDPALVENPRIDIIEYGAATQGGSYFMYTGTAGKLFEGADVPEQRSKPSHGHGGGSTVKIRKTGEDLLQAFIDRDPSANLGKVVWAYGDHIEADILIEISGRDGAVTSTSVSSWSAASNGWVLEAAVEATGVGTNGVEFSVNKLLLGDLSASETFFFTTDWKAESDNCLLNGTLTDPWAIRNTTTSAASYHSNDGISWADAGSVQLAPGDSVVAMAHSLDRSYVFAVTNTGRVYDWEVNADNSWGPDVTGPCNSTEVVGMAPNSASGEGGCLMLGANGWTWSTAAIGGARGWTNGTKVAQGASDFKDVCYNSTGGRYWAIRSGVDTLAYYMEPGQQWNATGTTGSAAAQSHVYNVGDADMGSERVFILCEDGGIRYSADGGAGWASRGDLPSPGNSGLPSYSRYVAIDRDSNGVFWVMTNTSYCYKSSDRGAVWTYAGNIGVNDIASMACPAAFIPEFESIIAPIFFAAAISLSIAIKRRRRENKESPDENASEGDTRQ